MSTRWHIGAKGLKGAISAYAKRFDLLEVRIDDPSAEGAPSATGPTLASLRRWRKAVPPAFNFAVVAGPHLATVNATAAAARALDAARVAIHGPPALDL